MSAVFSADGQYRYRLDRDVDASLGGTDGRVVFVCLNPSMAGRVIAGVEVSDPSATRMKGFASRWGFCAFTIINAFARISTDPKMLTQIDMNAAVGPENDRYIREALRGAALVIAAWGASYPSSLAGRVDAMRATLRADGPVHHLGLTKHGDPKHPLYLPKITDPMVWEAA